MSEATAVAVDQLRQFVRDIPDFPQPGILFRDITPLLANAAALRTAVEAMAAPYRDIPAVVAIESRGFILGAPIAFALSAGLIPIRKVGRLPAATVREQYALEYGSNTVEIHADAIQPGEPVVIIDDLLATGGTARAAIDLVERLGGKVTGLSFLAELSELHGRDRLTGYDVSSLIIY